MILDTCRDRLIASLSPSTKNGAWNMVQPMSTFPLGTRTRSIGPYHTSLLPVDFYRSLPDSSYCFINWWNWRRMESQSRLYYQCAEEPVGRGLATGNTLTVEPNVKLVVRTNVQICVQLSCERGAITRHKHSGPFMRKMSSYMTLLVLSNGTQSPKR